MNRDIWLDDDEPGCLECGEMVFKASQVSGICVACLSEASQMPMSSSMFEPSYRDADGYIFDEWDEPWVAIG